LLKFHDLRRFADQISAWHAQVQLRREAVSDRTTERRPRHARRPWQRRAMLAIALAGSLGAGGVFAASRLWNDKPRGTPAAVMRRANGDLRAAQPAVIEQRVPQTEAQPQDPAQSRTQDLATPRPPKPSQPDDQAQRIHSAHKRVLVANVAPAIKPSVPSYLGKPTVRLRVQRERDKIKRCYDDRLAVDPTLEGIVTTHFVILPSGSVGSSSARGLDSEIEGCVNNVLQRLEFPRSLHGVRVSYPFHFSVKEAPARSMSW
jgi:hypothetical protein